ncbi:MAG: endonuclease/exonuclease/phosphatase family protein [Planctomycetota bacterium]|nr:endonuclease/exonuclease/phosphatase family protein [Planctomycetota bacterium]
MQQPPRFSSKPANWALALIATCSPLPNLIADEKSDIAPPPPAKGCIRIATFNVALNRKEQGQLVRDLKTGDEQAKRIATIVQLVAPDVLLANEVDYSDGEAAKWLRDMYFLKPQTNAWKTGPSTLNNLFTAPVNTGVPSGLDLNLNGRTADSDDSWGYGAFPGQYGMAVFSRFPIAEKEVRSFQMFRWSQMPGAKRPKLVDKATGQEKFFHSDEVWNQLRLSSKSHWDIPIEINGTTLHVIASHPTPPVFDGPEDRNGCRNHDEIRLIKDYVSGTSDGSYLVDDKGKSGPLAADTRFVILGDLNSDPKDGSGISQGIIDLLSSKRVLSDFVPESQGAVEAAQAQGKANVKHKGNPANDTGDFNDNEPGNLRIDFVLPSSNCKVINGGVFWPKGEKLKGSDPKLADASDHHLVWLDIELTPNSK